MPKSLKTERYLGLMSGTSCDGFDLVVAEFSPEGHYLQLVAAESFPYETSFRQSLHPLTTATTFSKATLNDVNRQLSLLWAEGILQSLQKHSIEPQTIQALGIHGHTLFHSPNGPYPGSWQLCEPNLIAVQTGISVVTDFRNMDIALGGQGAPLLPVVHERLFRHPKIDRVICNIGGISNITVLTKNAPLLGYDTGPGNTLIDAVMRKAFGLPYDADGNTARSGTAHPALLKALLADPYFEMPLPKSTGREYFHEQWLDKNLSMNLSPPDLLATLTDLTAQTIATETRRHLASGELILCGGGSRNLYLKERIQAYLGTSIPVKTSNDDGIDAQWIEALGFAWLARQRIHGQPGNSSHTAASALGILGGLWTPYR